MSPRPYVQASYGRNLNPQENPSSVHSVSDFKLQNNISSPKDVSVVKLPIKLIRIKPNSYDDNDYLSIYGQNPAQSRSVYTTEGNYMPNNSYIQPSVSGNYILPNGSVYFDERLNLDYIDRAVKATEDNAYLTQLFSHIANSASHDARQDADRIGYYGAMRMPDIVVNNHYISKK
jgi:hypothetical protein